MRAIALPALLALPAPALLHGQEPAPPAPGLEHELLAGLAGEWQVFLEGESIGTATARRRLDGRFLEVDLQNDSGPIRHAVYTFGFDRRHGDYTVIAMDENGTYWVTARGKKDGSRIPMYGRDDDPVMSRMGFTKEFVIILDAASADRFTIETRYVDTRTPERNEIPFIAFELRRSTRRRPSSSDPDRRLQSAFLTLACNRYPESREPGPQPSTPVAVPHPRSGG